MTQTSANKISQHQLMAFTNQVLKGLGQIMLQENSITGLIFLAGIFLGSVTMGCAALLATCCATLAARMLKFTAANIDKGLYSFSAALTGVALVLFFKPVLLVWICVIAGAVIACCIQHFFISKNIPVFTLPFVLVTWLFVFIINQINTGLQATPPTEIVQLQNNFAFAFHGFGQVIFQSNVVSGLLFFIAVFISSPIAALYGLAAAVFGAVLSVFFAVPAETVQAGLFSYNAVLCAIVFSGSKISDGVWALLSVVLTSVISYFMSEYNMIQLTFPFVAATCITLLAKKILLKTN